MDTMCDYCWHDASYLWTCGEQSKKTCNMNICHEAARYELSANAQVEDLY